MSVISELIEQIKKCHERAAATFDRSQKAQWHKLAYAWMRMFEHAKLAAATERTDKTYEVSLLEKDGHTVASYASVKSANDTEIIGKAKQLVDGKAVEVHEGHRLVASFPPSK